MLTFGKLLEHLGLKWNPEVMAEGVVACRATSPIYLTPFLGTVPTLLKLRDAGYKLGVTSKGRAVQQRQKLIQLGRAHLSHCHHLRGDRIRETRHGRAIQDTRETRQHQA